MAAAPQLAYSGERLSLLYSNALMIVVRDEEETEETEQGKGGGAALQMKKKRRVKASKKMKRVTSKKMRVVTNDNQTAEKRIVQKTETEKPVFVSEENELRVPEIVPEIEINTVDAGIVTPLQESISLVGAVPDVIPVVVNEVAPQPVQEKVLTTEAPVHIQPLPNVAVTPAEPGIIHEILTPVAEIILDAVALPSEVAARTEISPVVQEVAIAPVQEIVQPVTEFIKAPEIISEQRSPQELLHTKSPVISEAVVQVVAQPVQEAPAINIEAKAEPVSVVMESPVLDKPFVMPVSVENHSLPEQKNSVSSPENVQPILAQEISFKEAAPQIKNEAPAVIAVDPVIAKPEMQQQDIKQVASELASISLEKPILVTVATESPSVTAQNFVVENKPVENGLIIKDIISEAPGIAAQENSLKIEVAVQVTPVENKVTNAVAGSEAPVITVQQDSPKIEVAAKSEQIVVSAAVVSQTITVNKSPAIVVQEGSLKVDRVAAAPAIEKRIEVSLTPSPAPFTVAPAQNAPIMQVFAQNHGAMCSCSTCSESKPEVAMVIKAEKPVIVEAVPQAAKAFSFAPSQDAPIMKSFVQNHGDACTCPSCSAPKVSMAGASVIKPAEAPAPKTFSFTPSQDAPIVKSFIQNHGDACTCPSCAPKTEAPKISFAQNHGDTCSCGSCSSKSPKPMMVNITPLSKPGSAFTIGSK